MPSTYRHLHKTKICQTDQKKSYEGTAQLAINVLIHSKITRKSAAFQGMKGLKQNKQINYQTGHFSEVCILKQHHLQPDLS